MNSVPRVSIGVPVHNGADLLERALTSLLAQTYRDFEVVISDNASTDGTGEIIRRVVGDDPRFRVVRHETLMPAMDNFSFVLREARCDLFAFLAYDDWWTPNRLESLIALFDRDPALDLAVSRTCWVFCEDGREEYRPPYSPANGQGLGRIRTLLHSAQAGWFYGVHRRESLIPAFAEGYAMEAVWAGDFIILLSILLRGRIAGTNDSVFFQYLSGLTNDRYKPKTSHQQRRVFGEFVSRAWAITRKTHPTGITAWLLLPSILRYANNRSWKIKRIVRGYLKDLVLFRLGAGKV